MAAGDASVDAAGGQATGPKRGQVLGYVVLKADRFNPAPTLVGDVMTRQEARSEAQEWCDPSNWWTPTDNRTAVVCKVVPTAFLGTVEEDPDA